MNHHEVQELKEQIRHDAFTDAVTGAVSYADKHRKQLLQWGALALVVVAIIGAAFWFSSMRSRQRQADLASALTVAEAPIAPTGETSGKSFPTEEARSKAAVTALKTVIDKDGGTREGMIARYYRGTLAAQAGDSKAAEADLHAVANTGNEFAPLAKIALAQLYAGMNRVPEAQNILRELIAKPSALVSKEQAQLLLAQMLATSNPAETKRILQSLKTPTESPAVARAAEQVLPQQSGR